MKAVPASPAFAAFPPTLVAAQARIAAVRPAEYARSRNAIDGAVSGLSPYITHGFVTLPEVLAGVAARHRLTVQRKFVFELGWRAFFRHRWAQLGHGADGEDGILHSLHDGPLPDRAYAAELPADVRQARTGIPAIDTAVRSLYATGYLHNHARMWLASYVVHLRKVHWRAGADWLIAHLLDGDLASNHLSWQWVAGTGSHKPYLFNADNVARHAPAEWHSPGSVLDTSYEALDAIARDPAARCLPPGSSMGVEEPLVSHKPPQGEPPKAERAAGRDVWLVHPWALGTPPPDLPAGALRLGVYLTDFHDAWPWSARRWHFVALRMAALTEACWVADAATLRQALKDARSVRSVADPHLPQLAALAACAPAAALFAEPGTACTSFSQWWTRATRGAAQLHDLPGLADGAGLSAGPLFDQPTEEEPHDSNTSTDSPGHRRTGWHRP